MDFYQLKIQLVRRRVLDQSDAFFLHAITFCPFTNLRANGYALRPEGDQIEVTLFISEDPELPNYEFETPVVHSINLGSFPSGKSNGQFEVKVLLQSGPISRDGTQPGEKPVAETTVSSTSADEDSKPI